MKVVTVGKREFIQQTSKYLKMAENENDIIITHQKKPKLYISPVKKKSIKDLRGIIRAVKSKGDINEPVFPEYTQW